MALFIGIEKRHKSTKVGQILSLEHKNAQGIVQKKLQASFLQGFTMRELKMLSAL
jgi:hypothetical protein